VGVCKIVKNSRGCKTVRNNWGLQLSFQELLKTAGNLLEMLDLSGKTKLRVTHLAGVKSAKNVKYNPI